MTNLTDDEILAIWDSCPLPDGCGTQIIAFARAIAAAEREQIIVTLQELYEWWRAKDEELGIVGTRPWEFDVIAAIRARIET